MELAAILIGSMVLIGLYTYLTPDKINVDDLKTQAEEKIDSLIPDNIKGAVNDLKKDYTFPLWMIIGSVAIMFMIFK